MNTLEMTRKDALIWMLVSPDNIIEVDEYSNLKQLYRFKDDMLQSCFVDKMEWKRTTMIQWFYEEDFCAFRAFRIHKIIYPKQEAKSEETKQLLATIDAMEAYGKEMIEKADRLRKELASK
jgi:hypothetical protein